MVVMPCLASSLMVSWAPVMGAIFSSSLGCGLRRDGAEEKKTPAGRRRRGLTLVIVSRYGAPHTTITTTTTTATRA
jgi:hypothetical protein